MIYLNRILTNLYLEEESVWPGISYLDNLISDHFRSVDRGHNPRHGIWNNPICLVCQCVSELTQMQKTMKLKTKRAFTLNTNQRKWWQPSFQLHLVTKFRSRRENCVCQHRLLEFIFGKWCCVWCSDLLKFFVSGKFTERFHFFVHG